MTRKTPPNTTSRGASTSEAEKKEELKKYIRICHDYSGDTSTLSLAELNRLDKKLGQRDCRTQQDIEDDETERETLEFEGSAKEAEWLSARS